VDVQQTRLAGIGRRYDFLTSSGQRIGVVEHRTGRRDLVVYERHDPDAAHEVVTLNAAEADTLAELLGAPRLVERLTGLREQVEGLATEQLLLGRDSPYAGKTLGDAQVRTRTGASIVAVVREGEVSVSPRPDFGFRAGDGVVVVGTGEGVAAAAALLGARPTAH
jgi:TrkA domain protein